MAENTNNPTEQTVAETTPTDQGDTKKPKEEVAETKMTEKPDRVKNLSGPLALITLFLSLPVLALVIWLLYMKDFDCEKLLRLPTLQIWIGVLMIIVFLISNVAVLLRSRCPVPGFFVVMVTLILILTIGLALVGAYNLESRRIVATPKWFKDRVRHNDKWENIKSCIYSMGACDDLASRSLNLQAFDFSLKKLSPIESGCCTPPSTCEMEYVNATFWRRGDGVVDKSQEQHSISDCDAWQNDQNILCYNCQSCRDGFVRIMESKWWKLGVILILMSLLLILSHIMLFIAVMLERYNG